MGSDEEEDHTAEFVQASLLFCFEPPPSFYPVGITTGNSVNTASSNHFSQLSQASWIASQMSKPQNKIFGT